MQTLTLANDTTTPVRAYAGLRAAAPDAPSFLFESVVGGERWGRYSIIGYRPGHEVILDRSGWKVSGAARPAWADALEHSNSLSAAPLLARPDTSDVAEQLAQAHIGYFAWDMIHKIAKVDDWPGATGTLAHLMGGATVCVFDALKQLVTIAGPHAEQARRDLIAARDLGPIAIPDRGRIPADVDVDTSDEDYMRSVSRAQEYIRAGDAFQIVLARTFSVPRRGRDPFEVYRAMRLVNPSPYMYFVDFPGSLQIVGASPEALVRLRSPSQGKRRMMTVRPIAGTRRRGKDEDEDRILEQELLADQKERAEHVMLIDLARNDVGRVARTGSVLVAKHMDVERYSHVMHIVSEVTGEVDDETSALDVLRAAFPAGTLSGAPKLRAMQIIRELEKGPRGIYGGAVGYMTHEMDFAIAIRTAICRGDRFFVTAGAGVVEASDPRSEAEETRSKARGVLCAIEAAE